MIKDAGYELEETAMAFLREVAHEYGQEESHRLYKLICSEVSEELGKRLLYTMLNADYDRGIKVKLLRYPTNATAPKKPNGDPVSFKILSIKEVRAASDMGLKEAKDLVEACEMGKQPSVDCGCTEEAVRFRKAMIDLGFEVR